MFRSVGTARPLVRTPDTAAGNSPGCRPRARNRAGCCRRRGSRAQRRPDFLHQLRIAREADAAGGARRMDAGAKQRLVRVDVADAADEVIVHQHDLDRRLATARALEQPVRGELALERLRAEIAQQLVPASAHPARHSTRRSGADRAGAARCRLEHQVEVVVRRPARYLPAPRAGCPTCRDARSACRRRSRSADTCCADQPLDARARDQRRELARHRPAQPRLRTIGGADALTLQMRRRGRAASSRPQEAPARLPCPCPAAGLQQALAHLARELELRASRPAGAQHQLRLSAHHDEGEVLPSASFTSIVSDRGFAARTAA